MSAPRFLPLSVFVRLVVVVLGLAGLAAAASAQTTLPTLVAVTRISPANVAAGAEISYAVHFTPGSNPVTFATIVLTDASGTQHEVTKLAPTSGAILTATTDATWLTGEYTIAWVSLLDSTNRTTLFYGGGGIAASPPLSGAPTQHSVALAAQGFRLTGGISAVAAPTLTAVTRTSAGQIYGGSPITYTVNFTPGSSPVEYISIAVVDESGTTRTIGLARPESGATFTLVSSQTWLGGRYSIAYVALVDSTTRNTTYLADGTVTVMPALAGSPAKHALNFAAQDFSLLTGVTTTTPAALSSLVLRSPLQITQGDLITYTYEVITGSSPITLVTVMLTDEAGTFRALSQPAPLNQINTVDFATDATWLSGTYKIAYVALRDNASRAVFYYPNGTISYTPALDKVPTTHSLRLSSMGFTVGPRNGPIPPRVDPEGSIHAHLINLSLLTPLEPKEGVSLGFVLGGAGTTGTAPVLMRAVGPTLQQFGVTDAHSDPHLDFFNGTVKVAENDDWNNDPSRDTEFARLGAFPFTSKTSRDASLYASAVAKGNNAIYVSGTGSARGTVLAELYDGTPTSAYTLTTPRLINISVLKQLGSGGVTTGFVVSGVGTVKVLIRAIGPGLADFGAKDLAADPLVKLSDSSGGLLGQNNDWDSLDASIMKAVGAFDLKPKSKDAALVTNLPAGAYTVQAVGLGGASGLVLVEIYEVPQGL